MKKSQFDGIDYMAVERFKPPIEKFKSNDDFQAWCAKKIKSDYLDKDFGGRQRLTRIQRKVMIEEWSDYLLYEDDVYNNATALLVLSAVTKDLKPNNDNILPILNKGALADCVADLCSNLKTDKNYQVDLNKMYQNKLRALYLEDTKTGETETKWVIIPSKKHDPENFEKNVEKLKIFSHKNWCTKSQKAKPHLEKGDFHVYLEKGQPKLGVRLEEDEIAEIQSERNNSRIPLAYLDIVKNHINEYELKLSNKVENEINSAEKVKAETEKIKSDLSEVIKAKDALKILNYFGYGCTQDDDGKLILEKYYQPSGLYTFAACGIDENWLLEKVKEIKVYANFEYSNAKELKNLEVIGGFASFSDSMIKNVPRLKSIGLHALLGDSQVETMPNLETIGGGLTLCNSKVKNLNKLKSVGGRVAAQNSVIETLPNLETIGRDAIFEQSEIESLPNLETIGGEAKFNDSKIKNLNKLKSIRGNANFVNTQIETLPNLETIGLDAEFANSNVKSLNKLKTIGSNANFINTQIETLPNLETIGCNAFFDGSQVKHMDKLKSIGRSAMFANSQIETLPNLEKIGWDAEFNGSKVKNLNKLKSIRRNANFVNTQIETLPNLERIGGNADFDDSRVKHMDKLKSIGGDALFKRTQIETFPNLETIGGRAKFMGSKFKTLGKLKYVGGDLCLGKLTEDLGDLESVGGNINFRENSLIKNTGKLKSVERLIVIGGACKLSEDDFKGVRRHFIYVIP